MLVILKLEIMVCLIVYVMGVNKCVERGTLVRLIRLDEDVNKCDVNQTGSFNCFIYLTNSSKRGKGAVNTFRA